MRREQTINKEYVEKSAKPRVKIFRTTKKPHDMNKIKSLILMMTNLIRKW